MPPALPPKTPVTQLLASEFVICAGSILFRHLPPERTGRPLEICILRHPVRGEWLLPKGRKDRGESLEQTALRETYEETGFPCRLVGVRMQTRAPDGLVNLKDGAPGVWVDACVEPFMATVKHVGERNQKFIWWFVSTVDGTDLDADGEVCKDEDTMTDSECFESEFVEAEEAVERLTWDNDRQVVRRALELVRDTYGR